MKKLSRKSLLACLLALALSVSLFSACGSGKQQESGAEAQSGEDSSASEMEGDGEAADEQPESEIDISEFLKIQDEPADNGADLTEEEYMALTAVQYEPYDADAPLATLHTSMGDIKIVFYPQYAPLAVENFLTHAANGYYDGLTFHRIIEEFMIQGGDPVGNGTGGESIYTNSSGEPIPFQNEVSHYLRHFRGAISMANSGADTNGSQFFIVQNPQVSYSADYLLYMYGAYGMTEEEAARYAENTEEYLVALGYPPEHAAKYVEYGGYPDLDYGYSVFGMVVEGLDIVDKIAAVETDSNDMPLESVIIESITIENA